ncbi:MAG: uridine kinase [Chloroflexi bacterium]|nr:uridine kinase [Chloroflexota bacterium]
MTEPTTTRAPRPRPLVIGIAGGSGSGKTTVAQSLLARVGEEHIAFLPHDAYYHDFSHLPPEARAQVNYDHPDALETELLVKHIQDLLAGKAIERPVYDFTRHARRKETVRVEPRPIILVEGILIFVEPELRRLFDIKIYVDTDADIRFIRRLLRDVEERGRTVESVIKQYLTTVRPMHLEFVEPSKRYADIIVPEGGFNRVALDMIAARVQRLLEERRAAEQDGATDGTRAGEARGREA